MPATLIVPADAESLTDARFRVAEQRVLAYLTSPAAAAYGPSSS